MLAYILMVSIQQINSFFWSHFLRLKRGYVKALLLSLPLAVFVGLRPAGTGSDYENYKKYFEDIAGGYDVYLEPGYVFLNHVANYSYLGYEGLLFFVAFVTFFFYFIRLSENSENIILASSMLFFSGIVFYSMGWIRFIMACSIVFFSIKYLFENKYFKFTTFIGVASLFHFSALIALSFIWIRHLKKSTFLYFFVFSISIVFFLPGSLYLFLEYVFSIFDLHYSSYLNFFNEMEYADIESSGLGLLSRLVLSILLLLYATFANLEKNNETLIRIIALGFAFFGVLSIFSPLNRAAIIFMQFCILWVPNSLNSSSVVEKSLSILTLSLSFLIFCYTLYTMPEDLRILL